MLHENLGINEKGRLTFAGADAVLLAEKYGTPLMLLDEERIRRNIRRYKEALLECFGEGSFPLFASKALCFKGIYRLAKEEGIGMDAVSVGELYTAKAAGFDLSKAYFHGNNKTDADIAYAVENGVGAFVVDNADELLALEKYLASADKKQDILLRITPGIDPHTHKAIVTGSVDSKFGSAIETGQAEEITRLALSLPHIVLKGFHCHVGSQIFDIEPFTEAADIMLRFIAYVAAETGYTAEVLNLGGGLGVKYVEGQPELDYAAVIRDMAAVIKLRASAIGCALPHILLEPGRSLVADAGVTLYTVGSVKTIKGYKSYVSVDGGMPDNPRYALYEAPYTVLLASKAAEKADFICSVVGRCCESGDILQENVDIPKPVRGDILAVLCTGAYNYAMASNYNRIPRPAVVWVKEGADRLAIRRESFEDMTRLEV
ncbi:MAG: diaminopimelate decarboxylase [Clostridia bacterium]|nr:diaminopimelate decarboxylase [Clostridia bacterium]